MKQRIIYDRADNDYRAELCKTFANFLKKKREGNEADRDSLILYLYVKGDSVSEIAERVGLSTTRVRTILQEQTDNLTDASSVKSYFALEEENKKLKEKLRKVAVAENNDASVIGGFSEEQKTLLDRQILDTNLPRTLRLKLPRLGYNRIWQIAEKEKSDFSTLKEKEIEILESFLSANGLRFGMDFS